MMKKKYILNPQDKICEGTDSEKGEILTFYIKGIDKDPLIKVFFQENRKLTKVLSREYKNKELIYETLKGGVVELCIKSLEEENTIKLEIDCFKGLYAFKNDNDINEDELQEQLEKSNNYLQELVVGLNDIINQEEMNYIVKKTFYEKVLDSLKGKN